MRSPTASARLYYAGECPKCAYLAKLMTRLARGRIEPVAMEIDETWHFYTERYPNAWGHPVLVTPKGAAVGRRVYGATIAWVLRSWLRL